MTNHTTKDPVQGLVDYVLEIKPYHSKIVEVLVEYVHLDCIDVTIIDTIEFCVQVGVPHPNISLYYFNNFTVDPTNIVTAYPAENDPNVSTIIIPGDASGEITAGSHLEIFTQPDTLKVPDYATVSLNDGRYLVEYVNVFDGNTEIAVSPPFTSAIAGDEIISNVIDYGKGLYNTSSSSGEDYGVVPFDTGGYNYNPGSVNRDTIWVNVGIAEQLDFAVDIALTENINVYNLENTDAGLYGEEGYEDYGFNQEAHSYFHPASMVTVDVSRNAYGLGGGNYIHHFVDRTSFTGHDDGTGPAFETPLLYRDDWNIVGVTAGTGGAGEFIIACYAGGNFAPGDVFFIPHPSDNMGWYSVVSSTYDAPSDTTTIVVNETVVDTTVIGTGYDAVSVNSNPLGSIPAVLFDPSTQITYIVPAGAAVDDVNVKAITYIWVGPYRIYEHLNQNTNVFLDEGTLDNLYMQRELITTSWFQYNIIEASTAEVTELDFSTHNIVAGDYFFIFDPQGSYYVWYDVDASLVADPAPGGTGMKVDILSTDTAAQIATKTQAVMDGTVFSIPVPNANILTVTSIIGGVTADPIAGAEDYFGTPPFGEGDFNYTIIEGEDTGIEVTVTTQGVDNPFTVRGDATSQILVGQDIWVRNSPGNDNTYNVSSVTFNGTDTEIVVTPDIPVGLPGGTLKRAASDGISTAEKNLAAATIVDNLSFGWTITNWYQYMVIDANTTTDTFTMLGDATLDIQSGQEIRIMASPSNDGIYTVAMSGVTVNAFGNTEVIVTTDIPADGAGGVVEDATELPMILLFRDTVGITMVEDASAGILADGGDLIGSWDYPYWDIAGFDENLGTLIILTTP